MVDVLQLAWESARGLVKELAKNFASNHVMGLAKPTATVLVKTNVSC